MGLDNEYHSMVGAGFHIAIGVPASTNTGNGCVPPGEVTKTLDCPTKKTGRGSYTTHGTWPALRGVVTWSVNWDRYSNREFQKTFDGCFG